MITDIRERDRKCRICGCTNDDCRQCAEVQGFACYWVEDDLCSRCFNELKKSRELEIIRVEISKLELSPNDVLYVKLPSHTKAVTRETIAEAVRKAIPDNINSIVAAGDIEISIISKKDKITEPAHDSLTTEDFNDAVKVIDQLITLFCLRDTNMDFNVIHQGLALIKKACEINKGFPITAALYDYMVRSNLLK